MEWEGFPRLALGGWWVGQVLGSGLDSAWLLSLLTLVPISNWGKASLSATSWEETSEMVLASTGVLMGERVPKNCC